MSTQLVLCTIKPQSRSMYHQGWLLSTHIPHPSHTWSCTEVEEGMEVGPTPLQELVVLPTLAGEGRGERLLPGWYGDFCAGCKKKGKQEIANNIKVTKINHIHTGKRNTCQVHCITCFPSFYSICYTVGISR